MIADLLDWAREHKASAFGLALVVLGCWALVAQSRRMHQVALHRAPAASAAAQASAPAAPVPQAPAVPAPAAQAGTERAARTARLRGEFENAARYADFISQAMSRPQEGGKFYALVAWKRCNAVAAQANVAPAHTGSDAFHDAALAQVQDAARRCGGVLEAWPTLDALYKVVAEQRGGRDVLLPEGGRGIAAPAQRETARADLDAALASGDRWAAAEVLKGNAEFLDAGNSTGDEAVDRQLRERAADVVACELVGHCRGGLEAALHCTGSGDCAHEDWREVVAEKVPETQLVIYDTMLADLHARVGLAAGGADARP